MNEVHHQSQQNARTHARTHYASYHGDHMTIMMSSNEGNQV